MNLKTYVILFLFGALFCIVPTGFALDYNTEAAKFDKRLEDFIFVLQGTAYSSEDGDMAGGIEEDVNSLMALKLEYRKMLQALADKNVELAEKMRNKIFNELKRISEEWGLNYSNSDIERIIGPWSGYEIIKLKKEKAVEEKIEQLKNSLKKEAEKKEKKPRAESTPTETQTETIPDKRNSVPTSKTPMNPSEETKPDFLILLILFTGLCIGLFIFIASRLSRSKKVFLPLILFLILPYLTYAGCVGQQCGEIISIKVWNTEPITLEDGTVLPAGTLLCDSDIERDGYWNNKCNAYCDDPECNGEAIKSSFSFKVEVKVRNTAPEHGYNTIINEEWLVGMHRRKNYKCVDFKVRLLPGEEKVYTAENCRFEYNEHMDPNYPTNNGWYSARGKTSRGLVCFTNRTMSYHFVCRELMFKIADSGKWAYVTRVRFPNNNGQAVLGKYGIKVLSPDPSNCPGDCVYVEIGEPVTVQARMKNYGVYKAECVKTAFRAFPNWHDSLNPIQYLHLPDYSIHWEYFSLAPGEEKSKTLTFVPVIPGHWRIDWTKYVYYEKDPNTGTCEPEPKDFWNNASNWYVQTAHTIYVKGPDVYLHRVYPPVFYFPPGENYVTVTTNMTVTTAFGTEAFTEEFPLIVEIYYYAPGRMFMKSSEITLDKGLFQATASIDQNIPMEKALGVKNITVILKYDPSRDIPGVENDALMNEWMAKAGHQGQGKWCGSRCEYGFAVLSMPVDFVKFIDLNEQFSDFYYFNEGVYYMEMLPDEERSVNLHMENPYTQQTVFQLSTTMPSVITFWKGDPFHGGMQVNSAVLPAATSDKYAESNEYWIKIKAPSQPGIYDINVEATANNVTDRVKIKLRVKAPPKANFEVISIEGLTPFTVEFLDRSTDDGTIVAWFWDLGDGNFSTDQNVTHTYASEGPFEVKLTVIDDDGLSDTAVKTIYPYTLAAVKEIIANDVEVNGYGIVKVLCNYPLKGHLQVKKYGSNAIIYDNNSYVCNTPVSVGPFPSQGTYTASFVLHTHKCGKCMAEKFFIAYKRTGMNVPENFLLEALIVLMFLAFLIHPFKKPFKKAKIF